MASRGRQIRRNISAAFQIAASGIAPRETVIPPQPHPADHAAWVDRRTGKLRPTLPDAWASRYEYPAAPARIGVLMHVFYTDLVPELCEQLRNIPVPFDLIVTNASGEELDLPLEDVPLAGHVAVLPVANHGRDILPMIEVVNAGLLDPYELVLKVHTKKSTWREEHAELSGTGDDWRSSLYGTVLGSADNVQTVLGAFAEDPSIGIVTADEDIVGTEFWGGDLERTRALMRRLQLSVSEHDLRFASGSVYWIRGFLLQGLRAFAMDAEDFEPEAGQVDGTTAHAVERALGLVTLEAGYRITGRGTVDAPADDSWRHFELDADRTPRARVIPFYLPQFHTFPENDQWWGPGFTEWSNVTAARPVFEGHNQPLLPSELGFYDLSVEGVRDRQYDLARSAGIEGFMYYYYWFSGKKLMDLPVERLHAADRDQPFCLMWANENWSRRWDGSESSILIAQDYDQVPAEQFIEDVMHLLLDPRYIRVDGKPLVAVYKIAQLPDFPKTLQRWRERAVEEGLPGLHIATVDVGREMDGIDGALSDYGIDAFLEFAPHNRRWTTVDLEKLDRFDPRFEGHVLSYPEMAVTSELVLREPVEEERYPGVMVNFDNTARRQWRPDLWYGSNPYTFRRWLNSAISAVADREPEHRIVFVNAWNEWAESAVLEPSQRFGRTFLLAVKDALLR
ncbi:Rhamnan synthesis protein F [Leifsonia sp. 98AMF]|uniref:glycoside hydrolase family 99-like domain-containing protein n=1 Tax=unclassified Leifsonia TaxID=2663824 RepID=UPI00087CA441|nr:MULTISPECIES: glycoside hydrolase family 99-like domain-containing protein [unclassified Leifsonia]SDH18742.1 Rhamnan synthesis protein F [Leifsonia sp. 197AMF]SDJ19833.1 Rhamnan synthesis protein F [Leifsonia sp. 466MF]SDJ46153.1 Rhamnan synthesis protein F [Leifsonia sp. 157MF]SDN41243.1 Rhamnan synthesis protein F [Leifsonia sp. 509MF]SEM79178.1 Rhamnan synthesis protein F [Leifsonia sp. 467MF]